MNPRTNIFSGFGVYTSVPKDRGDIDNPNIRGYSGRGVPAASIFSGFGAASCQQGYMEFPAGSGVCVPTISMPSSGCQPGTAEPWPGAGFCLPTALPAGNPNAPPMIPLPCPAGMFGVPPYCFPMGTPLPPGAGAPPAPQIPVPSQPPVDPAAVPAAGADGKEWVVPVVVGVGAVALIGVVLATRRRKATPNRRRRRTRRRR